MATPAPATKVNARAYFGYELGGDKFFISLRKAAYDNIASVVGLTLLTESEDDKKLEGRTKMTIGAALQKGDLFPVKIEGQKSGKAKGAKIVVVRNKIEEAFTGLKGKSYGSGSGWSITTIRPVLRRLISY